MRQWSILYGSPATGTDLIALTVQLPAAHRSVQFFSPLDLPTLFLFFILLRHSPLFFSLSVLTDRIIPQRSVFVFLLGRGINLRYDDSDFIHGRLFCAGATRHY